MRNRVLELENRGLQRAVRYAMALGAAKGVDEAAARAAASDWGEDLVEALGKASVSPGVTTDPAWAGPILAPIGYGFTGAVNPGTLVGRIGTWRSVPFETPAITGAAAAVAYWVGEFTQQRLTVSSFASATLPRRKVVAHLVETEELLRSAAPAAEATVGADMVRAASKAIDTAMLDPDNGGTGAIDGAPEALTYGVSPIGSSGVDAAAVSADLGQAIQALSDAGSDLANAVVIVSTRTAIALSLMVGSGGAPSFPLMRATGGVLAGLPCVATPWMPIAATTGSPTSIVVVDPSQIWLADDGEAAIEKAIHTTVELSDDPGTGETVSLWQRGLAALRLTRFLNWTPARSGMVAVIDGVEI